MRWLNSNAEVTFQVFNVNDSCIRSMQLESIHSISLAAPMAGDFTWLDYEIL